MVLKGARSVLCAQEGLALNPVGTPAMAKGGSGDALTGVMAALLAGRAAGAYAMDDLFLMQAACALHGLAGEQMCIRDRIEVIPVQVVQVHKVGLVCLQLTDEPAGGVAAAQARAVGKPGCLLYTSRAAAG